MINFSTRYCNAAYRNQGKQEGINQTKVGTAAPGQVLAGKTFTNSTTVGATGTMKNNGAVTGTITTSGGSYTIPAGYHNGSGKVTGPTLAALVGTSVTLTSNANLLTGNTAYGKNGVKYTGSMANKGAWTNTPTSKGKVTIPAGYHNGSGYVDTTSVYNKGMSDADARVNTNSESYKKGKEDFAINILDGNLKLIDARLNIEYGSTITYTPTKDEYVLVFMDVSALDGYNSSTISPYITGFLNGRDICTSKTGYLGVYKLQKDMTCTIRSNHIGTGQLHTIYLFLIE